MAERTMTSELRYITCTLCEASCGLEVRLEDDEIAWIRGHAEDPLSRGHICPKAVALQDVHADPDRLRRPVRKVDGEWVEIGWDEAIDLVASNLVRIQHEHGPDALAVYLGNPNVHSLGALTHGVNLVRLLRTKNTYSATSVDQMPHQLLAWALYGHQFLLPVPDIDRTDLLVLIGTNPMASNGSLMTVPDFPGRARELRGRGGRLVVIDPRVTETARIADAHHFVRPGTDAWVLLAVVRELLESGSARPAAYVDGLEEVREAVAGFTPELAEEASGMPAAAVRALARDLAAAGSAAVHGRMGVSTQVHGVVCQWAIQVINIITGNLDSVGGTMFTSPAVDMVGKGLLGRGHVGRWFSRVRGLPEFGGELPVSVLAEEIATPGTGQVRAMLTVAGNPVSSTPAGHRLAEALEGLEFMAAIDFYVNETTSHADVILPPTGPLEREHYDLIFHLLAVRNTARFSPALYARPEGTRHDWEIARDLALRVIALRPEVDRPEGLRDRASRLAHAAKDIPHTVEAQARFRTSPRQQLDLLLRTSGERLSVAKLEATPGGVDLGPLREGQLPDRLGTEEKRVDLWPEVVRPGLAALAEGVPGAPVDGDELLLIGRRHQRDNNSWLHNSPRLTKGRPRHQLYAHPDDLAVRGIADRSLVRVSSAAGSVEVEVLATEDMMRGVVSLPHGYGQGRVPGVRLAEAARLPGVSMNDLTDPARVETVSANAVLNGIPVRVEGVDGS
jgi:anaerobic selenocysteine-containing dehydrogenase